MQRYKDLMDAVRLLKRVRLEVWDGEGEMESPPWGKLVRITLYIERQAANVMEGLPEGARGVDENPMQKMKLDFAEICSGVSQ